ncbi:MAG TPA: hypothetical protein VKU01_32815 [Bryobacteraceae bacterium]|nr:hypothetical protein [Bryobacteraceae bacterium]
MSKNLPSLVFRRGRLILFAACLLLTNCQKRQPSNVFHVDPELAKYIPADAVFLLGVNADAIRNTPVYQKYIAALNLPNLAQFTQQTGLDPRKDISQLLSVSNGKTGVLLARGNFNPADLEHRLESGGARRSTYNSHNLFGDDTRSVVILNGSTAIAGSTTVVKGVIDAGSHGSTPPALTERVKSIPADSQIWAALVGGTPNLNVGVPENSNLGSVIRLFRGIDSAALGIDLRNGLDLTANAICRSDQDAKRLHDALKGIIGLGRLSTPDNQPDLLKLYDAIKVEQQQSKVDVTAQVPPDLTNRFIDLWVKGRGK